MKTQIKQTIAKLSALAFMFALVVGVTPSDAADDNPDDNDVLINAKVLASLQLTVDADQVDIQVDPDVNSGSNMSGGVVTDKTTTTVSTNNLAGYQLQIQLNGTGTGNTSAISSTSGTTTTENNFGYALNDDTISNLKAFDSTAEEISGSAHWNPTNGHDQDIYYYLNVNYTVPADTYQGTVTYTAVTLP